MVDMSLEDKKKKFEDEGFIIIESEDGFKGYKRKSDKTNFSELVSLREYEGGTVELRADYPGIETAQSKIDRWCKNFLNDLEKGEFELIERINYVFDTGDGNPFNSDIKISLQLSDKECDYSYRVNKYLKFKGYKVDYCAYAQRLEIWV